MLTGIILDGIAVGMTKIRVQKLRKLLNKIDESL